MTGSVSESGGSITANPGLGVSSDELDQSTDAETGGGGGTGGGGTAEISVGIMGSNLGGATLDGPS